MEIFSALLAICAGNSPGTGEFPTQRPVSWNFDVFFDLRLNKRLSKQSWGWWFETPSRPLRRHRNVRFVEVLAEHWQANTQTRVLWCHMATIGLDEFTLDTVQIAPVAEIYPNQCNSSICLSAMLSLPWQLVIWQCKKPGAWITK